MRLDGIPGLSPATGRRTCCSPVGWFLAAMVMGGPLGLVGAIARRPDPWGLAARLVVPVGAVLEPFYLGRFTTPAILPWPDGVADAITGSMLLAAGVAGSFRVLVTGRRRRGATAPYDPGVTDDSMRPDLDVTRVMTASPEQIWSAWIDPAAIARWWGPDGFTSTVRELDVREGGRFDVVMQGPDGSTFENLYLFGDVEAGERVTYVHQGSQEHGLAPSRSVVTIEEMGAGMRTLVTLRSFYASESDRRKHLVDFQAAAGARQLLERLEEVAVCGAGAAPSPSEGR